MSQPQPRFVAVATVKDEAPYLLEWAAWNRQAGIEHFVVFTNDCSDGTDTMLDRMAELGGLEHHPNPTPEGKDPQIQALRRAFEMPIVREAEWVLHFDADEFLDLTAGDGTLSDFVAACDPDGAAHAISIPWRYMGSHGQTAFEDAPVTQRFLRGSRLLPRETFSAITFKTLFRPSAFERIGIHKPKTGAPAPNLLWLNASGEDVTSVLGGENADESRQRFTEGSLGYAHGLLRHYAVKSRAEFLFKRLRGTAAESKQPNRLQFDYWLHRNINHTPLSPLPQERLQAAMAPLAADPVLADLHSKACAHLRGKVEEMLQDPANARFMDTGDTRDPSELPPGRFLCLGTHHKTGTIWMRRVLRQISNEQNIPMRQFGRLSHMRQLPEEGSQILVHWDADFPRPLYTLPEARFLHVIRDPRDVLLSGMRYHRIAPHAREKFLLETRDAWGGLTYQDYLNALPDDTARLLFEMEHKHAKTVEEMLTWEYGRSNSFELRYEDLIRDTDCALFRNALEWANIDGLDIDRALKAYWKHSLFGGLAKKEARSDRVSLHIHSGAPAQWEQKLPREVAEVYAERYGEALRVLGYAKDDRWVARCKPAAEISLENPVTLAKPAKAATSPA